MATKIIKAQITQRHDTRSNWESVNPVLLEGELGLVSDDPNLYKVGDGRTEWNNLPYRGFDGTLVQEEGTSANAAMSQKAVTEALAGKPDADGHYPQMQVGKADDLSGHGESVAAEFTFRATCGKSIKDGTATIKEMQGNAVVWNNAFRTLYMEGNNCSLSEDNGKILVTPTGAYPTCKIVPYDTHNIIGHKYAIVATKTGDSQELIVNYGGYDGSIKNAVFEATRETYYCGFYVANQGESFTLSDIQVVDLTKMYGAGNEPTTIEEYNARKPIVADEYAYNEGEVIAFHGEAIKSVGDNAWDEQWENGTFNTTTGENINNDQVRCKNPIKVLPNERYHFSRKTSGEMWVIFYDKSGNIIEKPSYEGNSDGNSINLNPAWISEFTTPPNADTMRFYMTGNYGNTYKHDIMLTLVHSGWKVDTDAGYQPYWADTLPIDSRIKAEFPNGMHKWDKVYNKDGKGYIVKGTGVVDLGNLHWYNAEGGYGQVLMTSASLKGVVAYNQDINIVCGAICKEYIARSAIDTYNGIEGISINNLGEIKLYDSRYTDAASFKAAMAGVILYYELADFGTEQLLASPPSAPFKGRTIYQFNAVDQIRDNAARIAQLEALLTAMQAQLTSLTNNPE